MPVYRMLPALFVCLPFALGADLKTLKGDKVTGDLVNVSDKEVVLTKGGEKLNYAVTQILEIGGLGTEQRIAPDVRYYAVELTDGSVLYCSGAAIKGKDAVLTLLLTSQTVKVPLGGVANILAEANVEKYRKDWAERLAKKRRRDVLAVVKNEVVNALEGTLGDGDDDGKTIAFTLSSGKKVPIPQENIHGLIFQRAPDPQAPPVLFKLHDAFKNVVMVSSASTTPAGLAVTTPSGARLDYSLAQLTRLDYSRGKLAFLSDLEPCRPPVLSSNVGAEPTVGRDHNPFSNEPIRINNQPYGKGLVLRAFTELEYDLGGEYREFKADVGVDDAIVATEHKTILRIEGDGKELKTLTVSRKDKERPVHLALNVKDVQKLKIIVTSNDWVDLGKHVTLADALVSK